jgi:CheY-like chemotaxis protein
MKQRILFIDNDKDELVFFLDALLLVPHDDGFKCTYAGNTIQACEMLKLLVPDFIFVNFNMPTMNGLEFIAFTTSQPQLKNTKLFLYSPSINKQMNRLAAHLGANCIKKPDTINELAINLSEFLTTDAQAELVSSDAQPNYSFSKWEAY